MTLHSNRFHRSAHAAQRGFSLIELSLSLIVAGLLAAVLLQLLGGRLDQREALRELGLLERADDALNGYLLAHWRLPCPDATGDGNEDCGSAQTGQLPWKTIGLPDQQAGAIRYGVLRRPGTTIADATDLSVAADRHFPLLAEGVPLLALETARGNVNGLDLCHSLRAAARLGSAGGSDLDFLHTVGPTGVRSVAYALAIGGAGDASGDGARFDGANTGNASMAAPGSLQVFGNDDRQRAVGPEQLWTRLHCGAALAAAGHAHFNGASAAAILSRALANYVELLRLQERMAGAAVASSAASLASAIAGTATAAVTAALALAQAFLTQGSTSAIVAAAAVAIAANAAAVISATASTVKSAVALGLAIAARVEGEEQYATSRELVTRLRTNALRADAVGLF